MDQCLEPTATITESATPALQHSTGASERRLTFQHSRTSSATATTALASSSAMADNYGTYRRESKVDAYNTKESLPRDSRSSEPADDLLEALGYTQQLARSRSTLNVMFMSFVLASVPYGLATTLIYPLTGGGPTTIIWGWVAVCLLMLCVAASLGEITSVRWFTRVLC